MAKGFEFASWNPALLHPVEKVAKSKNWTNMYIAVGWHSFRIYNLITPMKKEKKSDHLDYLVELKTEFILPNESERVLRQ